MSSIATLPPGFADPVHDAQRSFRTVLQVMSRPGLVLDMPVRPPSPDLPAALSALMLTLLDGETTAWLSPTFNQDNTRDWLRFHTGVRLCDRVGQARFVFATAAELDLSMWQALERGSDEEPEAGATLVLELPSLEQGITLRLQGPGIQHQAMLAVAGISPAVWALRRAEQTQFPRGVDLLLCCGTRLAGLPRSTRLEA